MHPLGVDDYVYLLRILNNEMAPGLTIEDSSSGVVFPVEAASTYKISGYFGLPVAGLYLGFYAPNLDSNSITLLSGAEHMLLENELRNDSLFILIHNNQYPSPEYGTIDPDCGDLLELSYTGTRPRLAFAHASGYYGEHIDITQNFFLDGRGDLNYNGISNEIADAIIFINYFLYGISAFTVNQAYQFAATDIKADGLPAQIEDFVYLLRIIDGSLYPYPNGPENYDEFDGRLYLAETDSSIIVKSNFDDSVGGLHLSFRAPELLSYDDYQIIPLQGAEHMQFAYDTYDDSLQIVVYYLGFDDTAKTAIDPGYQDLFEIIYTGNKPEYGKASAAGFLAEYVDLTISAQDYPPVFDTYPEQLTNDSSGGFIYYFNATDNDVFPDIIEYQILSGPGEIDSETGFWRYAPVCEDIGAIFTLEICSSDNTHDCPQADPSLHALMELSVINEPPLLGDCNHDGIIALDDIAYLINYIYVDGATPVPGPEVGDVDASGLINLMDITYLIRYLYLNGPAPVCP